VGNYRTNRESGSTKLWTEQIPTKQSIALTCTKIAGYEVKIHYVVIAWVIVVKMFSWILQKQLSSCCNASVRNVILKFENGIKKNV